MDQFSRQIQLKISHFIDLCKPSAVHVCDGSGSEYRLFVQELLKKKMAISLKRKGCLYFRSDPEDVARVEHCTFICSEKQEDAGPTNQWQDPAVMNKRLMGLFSGCMEGRTMYVIPYRMGPENSSMSKVGIEVTDSLYVCINMYIMTRMGSFNDQSDVVMGLHSVGKPLKEGVKDSFWPCNKEKVIAHFPQTKEIFSFGSGYGGNALLAKKCHALRIASTIAKQEGWLAEHMLIIGVTNPLGQKKYFTAAFPSACGKTNLAMMKSTLPGWKIECVGDDIAWMKFGDDGRLYAINPENGFFGVAPGTSSETNPNAVETIEEDTLFTNVALNGNDVWWEGLTSDVPEGLINWMGQKHDPKGDHPAAHPNSRFTSPMRRCPSLDKAAMEGRAVPIDGIIFGGRRSTIAPLIMEAKDWTMGVFYGASLCSEMTAAAEGKRGTMRHDPFAMLPFCGYNISDYFTHWLSMEKSGRKLPKIFAVNWFRKDERGKYIWPGYSENMRVIAWMFDSIDGKSEKLETPYGFLPASLNVEGLNIEPGELQKILRIDPIKYPEEINRIESYLHQLNV